jgi:hypothetical protein
LHFAPAAAYGIAFDRLAGECRPVNVPVDERPWFEAEIEGSATLIARKAARRTRVALLRNGRSSCRHES